MFPATIASGSANTAVEGTISASKYPERKKTPASTAADARNLGYSVEVVADGVTSFDEEAHHDALRELEKTLGATVIRSATRG